MAGKPSPRFTQGSRPSSPFHCHLLPFKGSPSFGSELFILGYFAHLSRLFFPSTSVIIFLLTLPRSQLSVQLRRFQTRSINHSTDPNLWRNPQYTKDITLRSALSARRVLGSAHARFEVPQPHPIKGSGDRNTCNRRVDRLATTPVHPVFAAVFSKLQSHHQ